MLQFDKLNRKMEIQNLKKLIIFLITICASSVVCGQDRIKVSNDHMFWMANKSSSKEYKISDFQVEAEIEDAEFQYYLGMLYFYGNSETNRDEEKAIFWLARAAFNGAFNVTSLSFLAMHYDNSDDTIENKAIALFWYSKMFSEINEMKISDKSYEYKDDEYLAISRIVRITTDDPLASSDMGEYRMEEIIKKAAPTYSYHKAAKQGDVKAQYDLAVCYYKGEGITQKNYTEAVYWYHKAAVQGYTAAQYNLASCYKNGYGVIKDGNTALYWYERALKDETGILTETHITKLETFINELKIAGYSSSRAKTQ